MDKNSVGQFSISRTSESGIPIIGMQLKPGTVMKESQCGWFTRILFGLETKQSEE
jgi:hypothetical protein